MRAGDPDAIRKLRASGDATHLAGVLTQLDAWLPTVRRMRPDQPWAMSSACSIGTRPAFGRSSGFAFRHRQLGDWPACEMELSQVAGRDDNVCQSSDAGYRFPAEVISHAVWLYFRFPLRLGKVDERLAARGIIVSHESVLQWAPSTCWIEVAMARD